MKQDASHAIAIQWSGTGGATYEVQVDDTPLFRKPIVSQAVNGTNVTFDTLNSGLAPGVTYYVEIEPGSGTAQFQLNAQTWLEPFFSRAYARSSWNNSGRAWMRDNAGVVWDASKGTWSVDPAWPYADQPAQEAYSAPYAALPAVNLAAAWQDLALLDELAAMYIAYEGRFTTLGEMRAMTQYDTSLLASAGPDDTKTLTWLWQNNGTTYVRECELCNSQFLYPAARLIRIITTLKASDRTTSMKTFVAWYAPLVTHDHVFRLFNAQMVQAIGTLPGDLQDMELWLAAEAAELLGANANEPTMAPLTQQEVAQLQQSLAVVVEALRTQYAAYDAQTSDFTGKVVGSTSYFNGAYRYQAADYAYSAYQGQVFPTAGDAAPDANASWDISHISRLPNFFRAFYDNRKATGTDFPSAKELQLMVNQYAYRSFQGNFNQPLFNNFFDGGNGWYRVGYHGPTFGYPPAQFCDTRATNSAYTEPCLTDGAVQGWGRLAFVNPDLGQLEHALASLTLSNDPIDVAFRQRYYSFAGQEFAIANANSQTQYPILLFFILGNVAENLH